MPASGNKESREMEALLRHTIELNKRYIDQSFRLFRELGRKGTLDKKVFTFRPELYSRAIKSFSRMNLDYYNELMDLGFSFAEEILMNKEEAGTTPGEPSFTLTGKGLPGTEVKMQFVLENTRNGAVHCELKNSAFMNEADMKETFDITARFNPQAFDQEPDESHTVDIAVTIGKQVSPGIYHSEVSVIGFEPSFFSIVLTVDQPAKPSANAKAKKRSAK